MRFKLAMVVMRGLLLAALAPVPGYAATPEEVPAAMPAAGVSSPPAAGRGVSSPLPGVRAAGGTTFIVQTIDMTAPLLDENDQPLKDSASTEAARLPDGAIDCSKCPYLTIGVEINRALAAYTVTTQGLAADDKWAYQALGMRIKADRAAVLTPEERRAIKLAIGKYPGLVVMRIFPVIDPTETTPKVK